MPGPGFDVTGTAEETGALPGGEYITSVLANKKGSGKLMKALSMAGTAAAPATGGASLAVPLVIGGAQFLSGVAQQRKAKSMLPPPNDLMEGNFLGELDRMRKSFETGSAYGNQLRQLRNIQQTQNTGIISAAGGNTGAAITGLARTASNIGDAYGNIAEAGEKRMDNYTAMYGDLMSRMAQRRADLDMMQYGQQMEKSAENRKAGLNTMLQVASLAV